MRLLLALVLIKVQLLSNVINKSVFPVLPECITAAQAQISNVKNFPNTVSQGLPNFLSLKNPDQLTSALYRGNKSKCLFIIIQKYIIFNIR